MNANVKTPAEKVQPEALPAHLDPMVAMPNWVLWRWVTRKNKDGTPAKPTKPPFQCNGSIAKNDDPTTWATHAEVMAKAAKYDGTGFQLMGTDVAALDLDNCRDPDTGDVEPWAADLVERCDSYAEVTPSKTGLRIIGFGRGDHVHRKLEVPNANGMTVEPYRGAIRFITVTGDVYRDRPLRNIDESIDRIVAELDVEEPRPAAGGSASKIGDELTNEMKTLLMTKGSGAYKSRSELFILFLSKALRARIADASIIAACVDYAYHGCGIHDHVADNGGTNYVTRQIKKTRRGLDDFGDEKTTDLGNARRLVRLHGENLRYVAAWDCWLVWEGGRWRRDEDGTVMRLAKASIDSMFDEATKMNDEVKKHALIKHALKSQSVQRIKGMVALAETEEKVVLPVAKIDADPMLLGVKNGVVDLRTRIFRPARRDDYITKFAGVEFDPNAKCPEWEKFIAKVLGEDMVGYPRRIAGYCLTGHTGEEVLFIPHGDGANGKSTWRETIFDMMGDYAMAADASLLITPRRREGGGATPDLARLHGKRLVTINETEENGLLNEQRVKFITSHDRIVARKLYEEPFDFAPTHKTIMTTNSKPIVRGTDYGIWRRLHLIPFLITIEESEKDVSFRKRVLLPELPGILNWALLGLEDYQNVGLAPPAAVLDATKEYRKDMDLIGEWIEERCERDSSSALTVAALHGDYKAWTEANVGFAVAPNSLSRNLISRGFIKAKVHGNRGLRGLRLVDPDRRNIPMGEG